MGIRARGRRRRRESRAEVGEKKAQGARRERRIEKETRRRDTIRR
jgi:hypothetical protein